MKTVKKKLKKKLNKKFNKALGIYDTSGYNSFYNTVDVVLLSIMDNELAVMLIQRKETPYQGCWALPGGFFDVEKDNNAYEAAKRELREETSVKNIYVEQLYTFSERYRDPRELQSKEIIRINSIAHFALINHEHVSPKARSDAKKVQWFKLSELPSLAFDHDKMINMAIDRIQNKINYTNIGFELMPEKFTIPELQETIELVTGLELDRNNFRKKIKTLNILIPVGEFKNQKGKPSEYFKLNTKELHVLKYKGLF